VLIEVDYCRYVLFDLAHFVERFVVVLNLLFHESYDSSTSNTEYGTLEECKLPGASSPSLIFAVASDYLYQ